MPGHVKGRKTKRIKDQSRDYVPLMDLVKKQGGSGRFQTERLYKRLKVRTSLLRL